MSTSSLEETTNAELVEAMERMDAGTRLAVPMLFDGLGPDPEPEPEIDQELLAEVAAMVAEFRHEAFLTLKHLDGRAPRHIHLEALSIVTSLNEFLLTVGEYLHAEDRS